MGKDPDLWRLSLVTTGPAMPELPEAIEDEALSVSLFAIEDEATADALGWRVDVLFRAPPDAAAVAYELTGSGIVVEQATVERVVPEEGARATELKLPPVTAGRFVVHGSHARAGLPDGAVPIEIDAGLAFGSGEHATTQACLVAIDRLARRHRFRRVLDVGCGSGVLAIAAAKCWPARVLAVDNDPIAVRVARTNVGLNGVARHVRVEQAESYGHSAVRHSRPFDLILANILADPLVELAPALARHLAPGGHAVLSGLLDRQAEAVVAAHRREGLQLVGRIALGPWMALVLAQGRGSRRGSRSLGKMPVVACAAVARAAAALEFFHSGRKSSASSRPKARRPMLSAPFPGGG